MSFDQNRPERVAGEGTEHGRVGVSACGPGGGRPDTPRSRRPSQLWNPLGDFYPHPGAVPGAKEAAGGICKGLARAPPLHPLALSMMRKQCCILTTFAHHETVTLDLNCGVFVGGEHSQTFLLEGSIPNQASCISMTRHRSWRFQFTESLAFRSVTKELTGDRVDVLPTG